MKYTKDNLLELEFDDLVYIWNDFCRENAWYEDEIYENDQEGLEQVFGHKEDSLREFARAIKNGEYHYHDTHFKMNGISIKTFSWHNDLLSIIDEDELLNWLNEREEE